MRILRSAAALLTAVLCIGTLAGCKVIPKGTEAEYTGEVQFDASAEAAGDWAAVAEEITGKAEDLSAVVSAGIASGETYCVSFTGTVSEYNTDSPKGYLAVSVDGVSAEVQVQVGSVYSGTTVRDSQTIKNYESFTNQTEWSEYAKTLNSEVQTNVVDPLGDLSALNGKTVTVVGCASGSSDKVVVTPVSLSAQ